jgi:hypothetical protein
VSLVRDCSVPGRGTPNGLPGRMDGAPDYPGRIP